MLTITVPSPAQTIRVDRPLPQAHAHNDYEHERPLHDALAHGFTSVEADVWLVDGELLVAHDLDEGGPTARSIGSIWSRWRVRRGSTTARGTASAPTSSC